MSKLMGKFMGYVIGTLLGIIAVLASSLALFLVPLFQTDELLAQIRVENVEQIADKTCFIVSLDVTPGNDDTKRKTILERQPLCGNWIGIGYEFTLPNKSLFLMKKPGVVITNMIAIDQKTHFVTDNAQVGQYKVEFIRTVREKIGEWLAKTPMLKSRTYDMKAIMKQPKQGSVITYKLEPLRQQVVVECANCVE